MSNDVEARKATVGVRSARDLWWCVWCRHQYPLIAMVFKNPTIETDDEGLCALLEPTYMCRVCAQRAQNMMITNKSPSWRRRGF
jgi:hypothetical protein